MGAGSKLKDPSSGHALPNSKSAATSLAPCIATKARSEEHTSELQSLTNLVCRLLLEKKKTRNVERLALERIHALDAGQLEADEHAVAKVTQPACKGAPENVTHDKRTHSCLPSCPASG